MTTSATDKDRTAIPRWRPISRVPSRDLGSISLQDFTPDTAVKDDVRRAGLWRKEGSIESYADLFDLGIGVGNTRWAHEGAVGIVGHGKDAHPQLLSAARNFLESKDRSLSSVTFFGIESIEPHLVFERIRHLKGVLHEYPRDSLLHCEIARLYSLIGQAKNAENHIAQAVYLSPNNRYILRAATKFFHFYDREEIILPFLRNAEGFSYDPWLQSAELAVAQSIGKSTKLPKRIFRELRHTKRVSRRESELTAGFALLEYENGMKRRIVNSILKAALSEPTENAIAQSIWVGEHSALDWPNMTEATLGDPQAWEARSRALFLEKRFEESEKQAVLWFADQQLEVRAALAAAYLNIIQLKNFQRAVSIAERAVKVHPVDWSMRNCAALACGYAGKLDRAREHIRTMARVGSSDLENKVFVSAAEGFVAFCASTVEQGREKYEDAILRAKRIGRQDLVTNAAIFWLEREAFSGSIHPSEAEKVLALIDSTLKRLPLGDTSDTRATFETKRKDIAEILTERSHTVADKIVDAHRFNRNLDVV